jgi:hypothetical protein
MTFIPLADRRLQSQSRNRRLGSAVAWAKRAFAMSSTRAWYLLDDRQLRDIGMSPLDAELARRASGQFEPVATDALAAHGLSAVELTRWVREGRRG